MNNSFQTINDIDKTETAFNINCDINDLKKHILLDKKDLTVVAQNIRSIYCNFDDFQVTLAHLDFDPDVVVLTECRLTPDKPIPCIPNYSSLASIHNCNQNDGVVVYVKTALRSSMKEIQLVDASCVQVEVLNCTIIAIYRSPSFTNALNFINSLNNHLNTIKSHKNIIVTGDININLILNSKDNSQTCNNRVKYLNMSASHGLLPGHLLPTRGPNCLDHFIIKFDRQKTTANIAVLNTSVTDHATLFLSLSKVKNRKPLPNNRDIIDYDRALSYLRHKNLQELLFSEDPDFIITNLLAKLIESLNESKTVKHVSNRKHPIKPWITNGILRCIRNRNEMQLKLRLDPQNEVLKITFKRYRNYCNKLIKKLKRNYQKEQLEKSQKNSKTLWNTIRTITNFKTNKNKNVDLLDSESAPDDAVNMVNCYFANIGKQLAENISSETSFSDLNQLRESCNQPRNYVSSFVLFETDPQEIVNVISSLKPDSAAGWDGIPTKFIILAKSFIAPVISHFANLCFRTGQFPAPLKQSIVTPVYKNGKRDEANSYRPISVLPVLSKIIEKLINMRLINYLNKLNILSNSQYGFRHGKSTEDAILSLTTLISKKLDEGKKCMAIFLDLKKAFDTVSLSILLQKLESIGIRGAPLDLFKNYLYGRKQRVRIGEYESDDLEISYGVPQGSVLGPTLFLIYINHLTNLKIYGGKVYSYADDTALVFEGLTWESVFNAANRGLNVVSTWLKANLLTLNISKTNYICFSINKVTEPDNSLKVKIHDCDGIDWQGCTCATLERVACTKYLGVIVDQRLSWHPHIEYINSRIRKLVWIFKSLRHVASKMLLNQIYVSLAQSVITYCISVWGGASKTKFLEIERGQRCLIKVMYFKPYRFPTKELYELCELLSVRKLYILMCTLKLHKTLQHSTNHISLSKRKRNYNIATYPRVRTMFARRQYFALSAHIYNRLNAIHDINNMELKICKDLLNKWLLTLDYEDTEAFLNKIN